MLINNDFSRLNLHDSNIDNFILNERFCVIHFDWGFLENYSEKGMKEGIVITKIKMTVEGYKNEICQLNYTGTIGQKNKASEFLNFSNEVVENWYVIFKNQSNETDKEFKISGSYEHNSILCWIDWSFNYENVQITWESHVLHKDWLNN